MAFGPGGWSWNTAASTTTATSTGDDGGTCVNNTDIPGPATVVVTIGVTIAMEWPVAAAALDACEDEWAKKQPEFGRERSPVPHGPPPREPVLRPGSERVSRRDGRRWRVERARPPPAVSGSRPGPHGTTVGSNPGRVF
jgi:hypothetical protein